MSESFDLSAECDHLEFIQKGTKICGRCGTNIQALAKQTPASDVVGLETLTSDVQALDPARVKEFKNFVHQVLSDGNELADVLDALLDGAQDMGISQAQAVTLIEQTKQEQEQNTILELKLSYDASSARAGVANGNTVLAFRIENASKKNIQKLSISILHPQTKNKIHLKPVTGLLRGMQKTVETDLVLSLVGFHSVRDGIVSAQSLTGAIEDYAIASEIRIYAENSEAARANISSQSFTTNMGGVISADGANSASSKKDRQTAAWEPIRLVRLTAHQQELDPPSSAAVVPSIPVAHSNDYKIIDPIKIDKSDVVDDAGDDDNYMEIPLDLKVIVDVTTSDLGPPLRILQPEDFSSVEKAKTTFEEVLNDFVRLLQILALFDSRENDVVWLRSQIDYFQLRQISHSLEIDPYDILAVNPAVTAYGRKELMVKGGAVIIGAKGLYHSDNLSVASKHFFASWKDLQEDGFSFVASADGMSHCLELSSAASGSYLIFDVSNCLKSEVRDELVSRLTKRFEQLLSTDEIIRKLDAQQFYQSYGVVTDAATKNDGIVAANEQNRLTVNDELLSDPYEAEPQPLVSQRDHSYLETCLMSFFSEYAQLSELYEPPLSKTIYIFNRNDAHTATVDSSLVDQLIHLLGHVEPVVVAVDALDQQLNAHAQLSGWTGMASVITQEGIYHVTSNDGNEYEWDRDASFLSWRAFRALSAGIQQRLMMPDIWLGSTTEVLIKGSYLNFEKNIIGWIDFHNIHQTKLHERFKQLSTAISTESL
jgi:hypothetical protein